MTTEDEVDMRCILLVSATTTVSGRWLLTNLTLSRQCNPATGWVDDLALVTTDSEFISLVKNSGATLIGYRALRHAMRAAK